MISKFTPSLKILLAAASFIFAAQTVKAQVPKNEGFDNNFAGTTWPNTDLPFGWSQGKITPSSDANNYWDRVNAANGVLPACTPRLGSAGMIRYRSAYCVVANERSYLSSRPYDLSARGAVTSQVSFWVYREGTAGNDMIEVYANNNPDPTIAAPVMPAPLTDVVTAVTYVPRPCGAAPIDPCGVWTQHTFTVPAANYSTNTLYIIIKATDAGAAGANIYIDDFSVQTYPSNQAFVSVGLDYQNVANVAKPSTDNWIIGCRVTVNNEGNQCVMPANALTFAHNGSTNPGVDIVSAGGVKLWWTGGTNTFATNAAGQPINAIQVGTYGGPAFPVPNFSITPTIPAPYNGLLNGNNYFWLTYNISAGAIANDYVDADFISATINLCPTTATNMCNGIGCAMTGARLIDVAYCVPSYTAGTSWLNGSFTNNDYVKKFDCNGDPSYPPGIHNDHNDMAAGSFPGGAGYPADPCVTSPTQLQLGTTSPFMTHPPDYQKFSTASVPNMCSAGTSSRTAVFLVTSVAPPSYPFTVQAGTWYGANYIAAFIDLNHDGIFNPAPVPGGERVFQSGSLNALQVYGGSFTLPYGGAGQYYGQTTMRVREWYAQSNIDGCSPGYYGEVEDYTVTLRPDCSPLYPGWKLWLGYTDDWNVNSNWCGGVPTINDNALIPGQGGASFNRGPNTFHPVIKSGVLATTRKLVMLNDTVEANAPVPGSLRVSDSLSIGVASAVNTSALIVDSSYSANAVLSNGVNINNTWLLFRSSFLEQKCQLMYKSTELIAQGMISGDVIDKIVIPVRQRRSTQSFNAQISMYFATNNATYPSFMNVGYTMPVPVAPANCLAPQLTAPQIVYSGPINLTSIPLNGAGSVTLTLSTPFTWNNTVNPLIIEICWSIPSAGTNDDTWQTQTTGYRSYLMLSNITPYAPASCAWTNTAPNGTNLTFRQASDLRPNLTFLFHRVFQKFPIQLETNGATTANWANYGSFVPANSIVEFKGTSQQNIDGPNATTFDELKINHSGLGFTQQNRAATVNDTLWLQNGRLRLNMLTLTLNNNSLGAITRPAPGGYLQSDNLPPTYGMLRWKMGSTLGAHLIPFWSTAGAGGYIPFTYTSTAGTSDLTIGTYYPSTSPPAMLPMPTSVTTINSYYNPAVTDAPNLVKRYWPMTNIGTAPVADLSFSWLNITEAPTSGAGTYVAQRWDNTGASIPGYLSVGPGWWPGLTGGPGTTVAVPNVNKFDIAWVLALQPSPLPVSLLTFTARAEKDKVKLDWTTASEKNNHHFTVERTTGGSSFDFIAEVLSHGSSTSVQEYSTYDYRPLIGKQFYRLTQTDLNGESASSKLIPVVFGSKENAFEILYTSSNDDGSVDVVFNYNSELPCSYKVADMLGNIVAEKSDVKVVPGSNLINVKGHLSSGVYTIMIHNQEETVTRKIFK